MRKITDVEVVDAKYSLDNKDWGSWEYVDSGVTDHEEKFEYVLNYKYIVYGDWGLEDETEYDRYEVTIDKSTGDVVRD